MKKPDLIAALDMVVACFENLAVAYYIGGSVATSWIWSISNVGHQG